MKKLLSEFKAFALRGNVVDLAIAVILGLAFNQVVQSLVNDVLMNAIAALFGKPDFSRLTFSLGDGVIGYGRFLTAAVNFVLVAFALFIVVKTISEAGRLRRREEEAAPGLRPCPYCFSNIPAAATRCSACTSEVARAV